MTSDKSALEVAIASGEELALRLRIPCDIVDVHRLSNSSAQKRYSSLRYGAFLLAYAALEGFFTGLTGYSQRAAGRSLPLNLDKIHRELRVRWPDTKFQTGKWEARTRQQPTGYASRSEWAHLKGLRLKNYMSDMKVLRDLLSHGNDPFKVTNTGETLWKVKAGWSMRLMGVEGFLQFVQDLATAALLDAGAAVEGHPRWPTVERTGISMTGLPALRGTS